MAFKTYAGLATTTTLADADLLATFSGGGPLKSITSLAFATAIAPKLATTFLSTANNLSELTASASTARTNIGAAGTVAPVITGGMTVTGTLALTGALTVTAGETLSGGMTFTGSVKQNVQALAALDVDTSVAEGNTKSISVNSTFTFSNPVATKMQAFVLELIITSAAVPTWPVAVKWGGGTAPTLGNGTHTLGFLTLNGGTTWKGVLLVLAEA